MQRLVYFLLMLAFFCGKLSAQDYFEELRSVSESIDSLIEETRAVDVNSADETMLREVQGAENRLGAARSEVYVLTLMGWLIDLARQHAMLGDGDFITFEEDFMQELEGLFAAQTTHLDLDRWVREQTATLFGGNILDSEYEQFTVTLNALNQNAITTDPQTGERVPCFPEDVEAFFESYRIDRGGLERDFSRLIQAVARSLFNLSIELAFSATQNPSISSFYGFLMEVIRGLYALIGRGLPPIGTIQLSPRSLVQLASNDNDTDVRQVQQAAPRRGSLSPRENFGLPQPERGNLNTGSPGGAIFHQRVASTGHSVLEFQRFAQ